MPFAILAVLLFSWVVPDHYPPWLSFHAEVPAFIAAVLAMVASLHRSAISVRIPIPVVFCLAMAATAALQWCGGLLLYIGDAILVFIYLITFAAAWLWGYQWAQVSKKNAMVDSMSILLVAVGMLTTFQIIVQWLQIDDAWSNWVLHGIPGARPRANVGQPNQAATALIMASVAIAVLKHRKLIGARVTGSALLLFGVGITLTQSRTALLSALLIGVLYTHFSGSQKDDPLPRKAVIFWVFLLYAAAWSFSSFNIGSDGASLGGAQMASPGARPLMWRQLIGAALESPWVGWGWLQVPAAQQAGSMAYPVTEQATYAHNAFLDLFLFIGLPGAGLVLSIVSVWWWRRIPHVISNGEASAFFLLLMPFLVHCLLEFPHAYAYFLVLAGLLLGGIDGFTERSNAKVLFVPKAVMTGFIAVWISLLLVLAYEYMQAEEDFRINRFENVRLGSTPSEYIVPELLLLNQLGDMLQAMRLRAKPEMTAAELQTLVSSSKRYSWSKLHFRTALALGMNHRYTEAGQQLRTIKSMFAPEIYEDAKESWLRLQREQYPELGNVELP